MRNATLRQLRAFTEVARRLSFTAAANALHLTQPAVSMQVRQLEEAAGLPLFEQLGKRVYLTDAGRELLRYAARISDLLREAGDAMTALQGVGGGELSIAVTSTAKYFAPRLLAEFRRRHPDVRLRLAVSNREAVVRELTENTVDLVVMGRPPRGLDTEAAPFAKHPIAIIAAPEHPLAGRKRLPLERLAGETFIIREHGSGTRNAMEHVFAARGFRARETLEMSSNETIKQAVMAGMGVAFLSMHTIGLELRAGKLATLPVNGLPVMREWYVIHRRGKRLSPAAQAFKSFLLEQGAALIERALG
ncbi:MAG: LysR family transcriptional regulator [Burkholderiales bacterium]|nr:LysR family transcriptional regulator [Burkholderiales bacterium]